jgi:hypothetical protein
MNRNRLLVRAQELRSDMRRIETLLQASVVERKTKCGKDGCRCTRGEMHTAWSVTYKEKGKTRTIGIDPALRDEVMRWAKNWKLFRRLLKKHNALLLQALRTHQDQGPVRSPTIA